MISHRNVITNVLQMATYERDDRAKSGVNGKPRIDVALGLLPQSHIYGLVVICCAASYRGGMSPIYGKCLNLAHRVRS
jgi:acyl-CoA synthetase (AMP-forming)/AMP-acid ligase II